ncbi:MAG: hypothetical protein AB1646_24525 [Thermodesulfobacteriota bacterium]
MATGGPGLKVTIVQAQITRGKEDETIRFIKQSYDFEDQRVVTYRCPRNLAALLLGVSHLTEVYF